MATNSKSTGNARKKCRRPRVKAKEQAKLSVVSVRISDEEKERIDEIMYIGNITHYSDVMRMAIRMLKVPKNDEHERAGIFC